MRAGLLDQFTLQKCTQYFLHSDHHRHIILFGYENAYEFLPKLSSRQLMQFESELLLRLALYFIFNFNRNQSSTSEISSFMLYNSVIAATHALTIQRNKKIRVIFFIHVSTSKLIKCSLIQYLQNSEGIKGTDNMCHIRSQNF